MADTPRAVSVPVPDLDLVRVLVYVLVFLAGHFLSPFLPRVSVQWPGHNTPAPAPAPPAPPKPKPDWINPTSAPAAPPLPEPKLVLVSRKAEPKVLPPAPLPPAPLALILPPAPLAPVLPLPVKAEPPAAVQVPLWPLQYPQSVQYPTYSYAYPVYSYQV